MFKKNIFAADTFLKSCMSIEKGILRQFVTFFNDDYKIIVISKHNKKEILIIFTPAIAIKAKLMSSLKSGREKIFL